MRATGGCRCSASTCGSRTRRYRPAYSERIAAGRADDPHPNLAAHTQKALSKASSSEISSASTDSAPPLRTSPNTHVHSTVASSTEGTSVQPSHHLSAKPLKMHVLTYYAHLMNTPFASVPYRPKPTTLSSFTSSTTLRTLQPANYNKLGDKPFYHHPMTSHSPNWETLMGCMYQSSLLPWPTVAHQTYVTNSPYVTSKIGGAQCPPPSIDTWPAPYFFVPAMAADSVSQAMPGPQKIPFSPIILYVHTSSFYPKSFISRCGISRAPHSTYLHTCV